MRAPLRISMAAIAAVLCSMFACKKIAGDVVPVSSITKEVGSTLATPVETGYKTQNVIIIVVDGARYSETWGDSTHQYIPNLYNMRSQGVMLSNFNNLGYTYTDPGHAAICTGYYEDLENSGQNLPQYPSIFQSWRKTTGKPASKAWVLTSKDKLQILANCNQQEWRGRYMPSTDCGVNGLATGYRSDDTTFVHAQQILKTYHPNMMLINFKDPDWYGHANDWKNYLKGIKSTDAYIKAIYDLIQSDETYKDKTTLIVTNDHGRHANGTADGFVSHGDGCPDCRHIEFFAIGPDFKKGVSLQTAYEQRDISKTVAKMLNFDMPYSDGKVMTDLFK